MNSKEGFSFGPTAFTPSLLLATGTTSPSSPPSALVGAKSSSSEEEEHYPSSNPLWPEGISEEDIDLLVEEILQDLTINIASVPDALERQIYCSTIVLCLNAVYQALSQLHGRNVLAGYCLQLGRLKAGHRTHDRIEKHYLSLIRGDVDDDILEQDADRLLANKAINQRFLPDVVTIVSFTTGVGVGLALISLTVNRRKSS